MNTPTVDREGLVRGAVGLQRLLVGCLALGAIALGGVLTALHFTVFDAKGLMGDAPNVGGVPVLTVLMALVAAGTTAAVVVVPEPWRAAILARHAAAHPAPSPADVPALVRGWQAISLIRAALCEAQAVLSLTLFLISGDAVVLGFAALMLALLALQFPSEATARRWLDAAEDELAAKRAGG